ncbi:MAG: alanine/glycine:cation symporter family protein, partial [Rhodospirillaceae bacterium]
FSLPHVYTAVGLTALTFLVLVGGLQRIAAVSEWLAPFMILFFMSVGIGVIAMNAAHIPAALGLTFRSAFTGTAAAGGFAGAAIAQTVRFGIARGLFSNEAGLGSAAILHAASRSNDPVRIGALGMLGACIDTLVVNSVTGLAIIVTGVWIADRTAAPLTALAFESAFPGMGSKVVTLSLALFAFTTIISWSFYGERCMGYLFGPRSASGYRLAWCAAVFAGASASLDVAWLFADIMNALMALPNLIALLALSPVVFAATRARLSGGQPLVSAAVPAATTVSIS